MARRSARTALTLVELLAATTLAVLLVVSVLSVLRTLTKSQATTRHDSAADVWQQQFIRCLHWDLVNSRTLIPMENGFELTGFAGRDFATRSPIHCAAIIRYHIAESDINTCLVREEIHPESLSLANRSSNLVCLGVDKIVLSAAGEPTSGLVVNGDGAIPNRLRVELYQSSQAKPVLDQQIELQ